MKENNTYQQAFNLLHRACSKDGFLAAANEQDNYNRVWTRDAVICGLAGLISDSEILIETFKKSLESIWLHQHPVGYLPSNVDTKNNQTSYGGAVGRADTASWAIIGLVMYTIHSGNGEWANKYLEKIKKAFRLMDAWEFNGRELIYVPQGGDWADEFLQHGYILYDQLLRIWALELAGKLFSQDDFLIKAGKIKKIIQHNFFYRDDFDNWYNKNMMHQKEMAPKDFWWMGFNPAQIYPQFDLQANALVLLLKIGNASQNDLLLNHTKDLIAGKNRMLESFSPAITDSEWQMNELKDNFSFRFRNNPNEFHNGGLWPVWNGWMITALKMSGMNNLANELTTSMHTTVSRDNFEMNECYHGISNIACGVKECAWSAAGVIFAEKGTQLFYPPYTTN